MRPLNCVMASFAVLLVAIIFRGLDYLNLWRENILGMLVVFLAVAGGSALNDYYDREKDTINHPERPIPSGEIAATSALKFGIALFALALLLSALINFEALLIAALAEAAMFLYESRLKRLGLWGNLTISALVGLIFIFGGAIYGDYCKVSIFALMAGAANLGREIVKDIEDMEGDINRVTLPKRIGKEKAGIVAAMAFLFAVLLSPVPYLYLSFSPYYLASVAISDAIFIYTSAIQFKDPTKGQRSAKIGMLLGLLSYLIGGLT